MMKLAHRLSLTLLITVLSACVPTVSKVFQSPKVTGQVVDLATLQPLAGVNVAHQQSTERFVTTDANGEFELPSISETEFELLMAGYALKDNLVSLYNQDNQMTLIVQASLNGRAEETVELSTIIFDTDPKSIAAPQKPNYLEYNLLRIFFYPHSLLGSCNKYLSLAALSSLNSSRKLANLAKSKPRDKEASQMQQLTAISYQRTQALWNELKSSCERTSANYKQVDEVFSSIEDESADFNF